MLDSSFGCALYIRTGAYSPFPWDSYLLLCGMTILIHGYRDVRLILTDSSLYIRYPHWGIFPSPWWDCVWAVVRGWMIIVCCLSHDFDTRYPYWGIFPFPWWDFDWVVVWGWMIIVGCLPHDFDIGSYTGAYFPIFFEYPWDWDSGQLGFRLSTSPELPTIDCIRASLHGFFEIEMDRITFHSRSVGGSFSQMFMRQTCFRHCYLAYWVIQMSSTFVYFEICF